MASRISEANRPSTSSATATAVDHGCVSGCAPPAPTRSSPRRPLPAARAATPPAGCGAPGRATSRATRPVTVQSATTPSPTTTSTATRRTATPMLAGSLALDRFNPSGKGTAQTPADRLGRHRDPTRVAPDLRRHDRQPHEGRGPERPLPRAELRGRAVRPVRDGRADPSR